jgi:hypothetical protein
MSAKLLIARFPYGGVENTKGVDWLVKSVIELKSDKRIDAELMRLSVNDTPITMTRNLVCKAAQDKGADIILMIDNDIVPDWQAVKPFLKHSLDFMFDHKGPCVVASPYCGPPPHENIYVFQWVDHQSDNPDETDFRLAQFSREQAAIMAGIQEVAALPTGLILMHTAALRHLPLPWFSYEYTDDYEVQKASTEDVVFTRNCSMAGVAVYCNWDSWSGHVKQKIVGKPQILRAGAVTKKLREAIRKNVEIGEAMVDVNPPVKAPKPKKGDTDALVAHHKPVSANPGTGGRTKRRHSKAD